MLKISYPEVDILCCIIAFSNQVTVKSSHESNDTHWIKPHCDRNDGDILGKLEVSINIRQEPEKVKAHVIILLREVQKVFFANKEVTNKD